MEVKVRPARNRHNVPFHPSGLSWRAHWTAPGLVLKGHIFTKPPIFCSIRAIGAALSTAAKQAPALQVLCIIQHCMMGGSLKMSGIIFLGKFAQHCISSCFVPVQLWVFVMYLYFYYHFFGTKDHVWVNAVYSGGSKSNSPCRALARVQLVCWELPQWIYGTRQEVCECKKHLFFFLHERSWSHEKAKL